MYRKEFFILSTVALSIFATVAVVSLMMQRALQRSAEVLAIDTLPGLINAGAAIDRMSDNWQNLRSLTELPTAQARSNMIQKIEANNTQELWKRYGASTFDSRDRQLFEQTLISRTNSRVLVFQYYDQVNAQKLESAREFLNTVVQPAFLQYKSNAFGLFQLNTEVGQQHAAHIIRLSHWLPIFVGLFCLLVFLLGVFVGLKGAFGSLVFASRAEDSRPHSQRH
jgi:hypothetical protein